MQWKHTVHKPGTPIGASNTQIVDAMVECDLQSQCWINETVYCLTCIGNLEYVG